MVAALVLGLFLKKSTALERGPTGALATSPPYPPLSKGTFIGVGIVCLLVIGVLSPSPSKPPAENPVVKDGGDESAETTIRIDAQELATRYLENPALAQSKFRGRNLEVSGIAGSSGGITLDGESVQYREVAHRNELRVYCIFRGDNSDNIGKPNQKIVVKGKWRGLHQFTSSDARYVPRKVVSLLLVDECSVIPTSSELASESGPGAARSRAKENRGPSSADLEVEKSEEPGANSTTARTAGPFVYAIEYIQQLKLKYQAGFRDDAMRDMMSNDLQIANLDHPIKVTVIDRRADYTTVRIEEDSLELRARAMFVGTKMFIPNPKNW